MDVATLIKILNHRPQLVGEEHGREDSIRTMMIHYYTSHDIPLATALEIVEEYISDLSTHFGA